MNLEDKDLKRLYRSFISLRTPKDRKGCPSWKQLLFFFEARAKPAEKLKIIDHVTTCSACAQEFEFLLDLQRYQERITGNVQESRAKKSFLHSFPASIESAHPLWRFSSAVVGMILVMTSIVTIIQNGGRKGETRAIRSSVTLLEPVQGQFSNLPLTFKWEGWHGAENYVLELYDETLLSIWKSPETSRTHLALPPETAARLQPGRPYFWMITAYRHKEKVAESGLFEFTVIQEIN